MVAKKKPKKKNSVKAQQSPPKKRKRRKKGRYRTGTHKSPKASKPIDYRSGWELEVCKYLDHEPSVVSYEYETIIIPYISNIRTGKVRRYFPDFLVTYQDGKRVMVEVKRNDKLTNPLVMKKTEAGRQWCQQNGAIYELWCDTLIGKIKKINEVVKKCQNVRSSKEHQLMLSGSK
jgi:hypothetical protein